MTVDQQSVEVLAEHVEEVVQRELGQKAVDQWTNHVLSQLAVTIYHLHLHIPQNTMKIRSRATWQDTFSFYKSLFNSVAVKLILSWERHYDGTLTTGTLHGTLEKRRSKHIKLW